MNIPKIQNMQSSGGNDVPNQFIIITNEGEYFQSYSTIIAFIPRGIYTKDQTEEQNKIQLDINSWDYSVTTGKYRNKFLNENKKETEAKIKAGTYKLVDLNK